ncbi:hypothetical protein ANANG_G00244540 [Anguilla anguilla]|uniref:Matrix remodeling-associated protein 8 n=1 Tax=Anguilla anguilla TaxID=7936 RepID=A0A9D3LR87_ANGAN|nr:hypothetical protein ANANG_G00244540 [Anguilla anguilla]
METARVNIIARILLLFQIPAAFLHTVVSGQNGGESVVVAVYNISAPTGSEAVLQCHSQRMVWTQDRLKDRQRVVHWDLFRSPPDFAMERLLDMFSAGDQRIYNGYNKDRVSMSKTAFDDGNFSLVIKDVSTSDRGIYSCNLHHHYCHLYETTKVQLNVTKSPRKERRFWDGEKAVFVALAGARACTPATCTTTTAAWTRGASSTSAWDPRPCRPCRPRRPALPDLTTAPHVLPNDDPHTNVVEVPHVINFIVPEHRGHFLQQLGYILATVLMLALIAIGLILLSRRCKKRALEYDLRRSERGNVTTNDFEMGVTELKMCNQEEMRRDYKNNLLKEKAEMCKLPSPKVIDLDKEMDKTAWK